jgi:hypothetical protein
MVRKILPLLVCLAALLGFSSRASALTLSRESAGSRPQAAGEITEGTWLWNYLHPWSPPAADEGNALLATLGYRPDFWPEGGAAAPEDPGPKDPGSAGGRGPLPRLPLSNLCPGGCSSPPSSGPGGSNSPAPAGILAYEAVVPPVVVARLPRAQATLQLKECVLRVFRPPRP